MKPYVRTTNKGSWGVRELRTALREVKSGRSLRSVSQKYNIPRRTLRDRVALPLAEACSPPQLGRGPAIPPDLEEELAERVKYLSDTFYGITREKLAQVAFEFAERQRAPHTFSRTKRCAGPDWVRAFLKRHPDVSIRQAENMSLTRLESVSKNNLRHFYDNLADVFKKHGNYPPHRIFNVDETGLQPVVPSPKVLAKRGTARVGRVSSAERGKTTTAVCCVSAAGTSVPPMLIFGGRKKVDPRLLKDAPRGTIMGSSDNGWITSQLFCKWMDHFIDHAGPSQDRRVLLIMDNHKSHISMELIGQARKAGVDIVTIPPHTSHIVQPLDIAVFAGFKAAWRRQVGYYHDSNPGARITDYDIAGIFAKAYEVTFSKGEVLAKGFESSGVHPYNPDKVLENEQLFLHNSVVVSDDEEERPETDDPGEGTSGGQQPDYDPGEGTSGWQQPNNDPGEGPGEERPENDLCEGAVGGQRPEFDDARVGAPRVCDQVTQTEGESVVVSPILEPSVAEDDGRASVLDEVLPLPKVKVRRSTRGRKRQTSVVLTSSPVKRQLEEAQKKSPKAKASKRPNKGAKKSTDVCMFCDEGVSQKSEIWLQCIKCEGWCHEMCSSGPTPSGYICDFCRR